MPIDYLQKILTAKVYDVAVETPLDEDAVRKAAQALKAEGVKAVAIGFLYGFVRPEHEQAAARIVAQELPDAFVSVGHEVAPSSANTSASRRWP